MSKADDKKKRKVREFEIPGEIQDFDSWSDCTDGLQEVNDRIAGGIKNIKGALVFLENVKKRVKRLLRTVDDYAANMEGWNHGSTASPPCVGGGLENLEEAMVEVKGMMGISSEGDEDESDDDESDDEGDADDDESDDDEEDGNEKKRKKRKKGEGSSKEVAIEV